MTELFNGLRRTFAIPTFLRPPHGLNRRHYPAPPRFGSIRIEDLPVLWCFADVVPKDGLRRRCGIRCSEEADAVGLQQGNLVAEMLLGTETHDGTGRSESPTTRTDLGRVKEEEAGVEKRCRAGFSANTILLGHIGLKDSIEDVKKAQAQTITGVRVEVADLIIVVASEWRRCNAHEEDGHVPARIRHVVDAQGPLDTRGPAIKALVAGRNALFACRPAL